jgi:hypothetical protein
MHMKDRGKKLEEQLHGRFEGIFSGVQIWIDGFLEDTTDIEMKRIVKLAGGDIR